MTTVGNQRAARQIGRFVFTDLIDERGGSELWRATDSALNRDVLVRLLPLSDPRALDLEEAAVAAAAADSKNLVKVLDVLNTGAEVAVVTEYVVGRVLTDFLNEPLPPGDALRVALEVSRGLEVAHDAGIAHGRLRPSHVVIGDNGEIKVAGLGIDGVLLGLDPSAGEDPLAADIHGTGCILYACLTGRWPDAALEGLPAAPRMGKHVPPPARVLADVPEGLDQICAQSVLTILPPRGAKRFTDQSQVTAALTGAIAALGRNWSTPVGVASAATMESPKVRRALQAGGVVAGVGVLAVAGMMLTSGNDTDTSTQPAPAASSSSAAPKPSAAPVETVYVPDSIEDFDPLGNGEENPGRVERAIDGNLETSWRTVNYFQGMGKTGVGLLIDLGAPRPVSTVKLNLVGNGTSLEIRTAMKKSEAYKDYAVLAQAKEAGEKVTMRAPRPKLAQYVLVWLTDLPSVQAGKRGGIAEVKISG